MLVQQARHWPSYLPRLLVWLSENLRPCCFHLLDAGRAQEVLQVCVHLDSQSACLSALHTVCRPSSSDSCSQNPLRQSLALELCPSIVSRSSRVQLFWGWLLSSSTMTLGLLLCGRLVHDSVCLCVCVFLNRASYRLASSSLFKWRYAWTSAHSASLSTALRSQACTSIAGLWGAEGRTEPRASFTSSKRSPNWMASPVQAHDFIRPRKMTLKTALPSVHPFTWCKTFQLFPVWVSHDFRTCTFIITQKGFCFSPANTSEQNC